MRAYCFAVVQEGYAFDGFHNGFAQARGAFESSYQSALNLLQQDLTIHLPKIALEEQLVTYVNNLRNETRYLLTVELPRQLNQSLLVLGSVGCT